MLGSTRITALLGSAPPATADNATLKAYAKALAAPRDGDKPTGAGLALFLVTPGGKTPAECRTRQAITKDTKDAEAAGLPKPTGLHMATTNATHLGRWIDRYRKTMYEPTTPVNFAAEVGRSRLIVVDVDTEAELAAFRAHWAAQEGNPALEWVAPTVASPGVQDTETGEWIHRGGGHYYFTLPEGYELPEGTPTVITMGDVSAGQSWAVRIRDAYVLIPPSVRAEGAYYLAGTDHPVPAWLLEEVTRRGTERAERRAAQEIRRAEAEASGTVDGIDTWSMATSWDEILEAADWVPAGRADSCTCEIWTRPGNPANTKSATAHGQGCSDGRYDPVNPPIHVWSDNVDGGLADWIAGHGKTLSKLQFVAAVHHGGDVSKAMSKLGIAPEGEGMTHGEAVSSADLAGQIADVDTRNLTADLLEPSPSYELPDPLPAGIKIPEEDAGEVATLIPAGIFADPSDDAETTPTDAKAEKTARSADAEGPRRPTLAPFSHWRGLPPPEFIVDGWIEDRALSAFIGPSGVGKSAVVLDMACAIATGAPWQGRATKQAPVLYVAGEGVAGAVQRVKAWETEHGLDVSESLYMTNEAILIGSSDRDLWTWLGEQVKAAGIRLVIFDTLARMSLGLEENSASDMGNAVARFDRLRREGETGVMVVHHTARGASHGRGSTAILGALDSEVLISTPDDADDDDENGGAPGKLITATVTKQKNAEDGATLSLTLCARHGSIVVADATGNTVDSSDPFAVPAPVLEFARPTPETDTELAVRLAEYIDRFPMQGATATDMVRDVLPSKAYRKDAKAWRGAVKAAVDRGLATGLLRTLGSDAAQRYIRGSATAEEAHALDRAEAADRAITSGA